MAFEVFSSTLTPEQTTVASYSLSRLGAVPQVFASFVETVAERLLIRVDAVEDVDEDGEYEILYTTAFLNGEVLPKSGSVVTNVAGTVVGNVVSTEYQAAIIENDVEVSPARHKIVLTVGIPSTVPTSLYTRRVNRVGEISHVGVEGARSWSLQLSSDVPDQLSRMQQMMVAIVANVLESGLTELGVSVTNEQIQQTAMSLAAQGRTIDAFISEELERLELDRRSGALTSVGVLGNAPSV